MAMLKKLEDTQLADFDGEAIRGTRWDALQKCIDPDLPKGDFHWLDVSGGNGSLLTGC